MPALSGPLGLQANTTEPELLLLWLLEGDSLGPRSKGPAAISTARCRQCIIQLGGINNQMIRGQDIGIPGGSHHRTMPEPMPLGVFRAPTELARLVDAIARL